MKKRLMILAILMAFAFAVPAQAAFYTDQATWEADVGTYSAVDLSGLTSGGTYGSVDMGDGQTLSFVPSVQALQVPDSWGTWAGGRTPMVLWTQGATSVTGTFSGGYTAFGLYVEPNPFGVYTITLTTTDGFVSSDIAGEAGASFMGFASSAAILSWTLSSSVDFAFGEMEYGSAVPEPATMLLLGLGLIGLAGARRKYQK